jgi:prophage antirepressor-like protein
MNALTPFTNGEFRLFVEQHPADGFHVQAPSLARALGFRDATDLLRSIPDEEKGSELVRTPGGEQMCGYLTEAGFYRALGQRQAARVSDETVRVQVERFQNWVYREVLPSLRTAGRYDVPADFATALELAAKQAREIAAQRAELSIVKPQAEAWTTLADTGADYSVREAAYILNRDPSINTGQVRLFALLREWRVIGPGNKPYANHAKHVTLRPQTRRSPMGERIPAAPQVRVTVEGLAYLHKRMGGTEPLDTSGLGGAA